MPEVLEEQKKQPFPPSRSTDLAIAGQQVKTLAPSTSFAPRTFEEALTFCKFLANSELVPKDYKGKPENVFVAIQMGAELGIAPMQALSNIAVINGRGSVWGDLLLAIVMAHPAYEWHKEWIDGTGDGRTAHFQIKRRGQEVHEATYSVADAKTAKLWGKTGREGQPTPWVTSPDRMLQMRARGFGCRDKFADALKGVVTTEEARDYDIIDGGPLVEQTRPSAPDPNDQPITKDEAKSLWDASKSAKHSTDEYKDALKRIAGVDSSAKIPRRHLEAMMTWAKTPCKQEAPIAEAPKQEEKPAENMDAEPCEDGK